MWLLGRALTKLAGAANVLLLSREQQIPPLRCGMTTEKPDSKRMVQSQQKTCS
jgi:hypothetical protein